jgi:RNA polymerase sigma-70 factor (ECF subfamily)
VVHVSLETPSDDEIVRRAAAGDGQAQTELVQKHRKRLKAMVALRLDSRLAARIDPSDVVQETWAEAFAKLPDYVRTQPLPFYPWLRQLAWERMALLYRHHVQTQARSVRREAGFEPLLSEASAAAFAERLLAHETSAGQRLVREEARAKVRAALDALRPADREILVLRFLEQIIPSTPSAWPACSPRCGPWPN